MVSDERVSKLMRSSPWAAGGAVLPESVPSKPPGDDPPPTLLPRELSRFMTPCAGARLGASARTAQAAASWALRKAREGKSTNMVITFNWG